jgi:hypothetical protein
VKRALPLAFALLALGGCGSDDERTVTETQTVTPTAPTTATTPATTTATTTAGPAPGETVRLESFRSPTGNIGCQLGAGAARCDIDRRDWSPPPKPGDCEFDWGQGIAVEAGRAEFVCAGDTARDPTAPVLRYGQDSQIGGFRCASRQDGITCRSSSGRGFFIARDRYRLF